MRKRYKVDKRTGVLRNIGKKREMGEGFSICIESKWTRVRVDNSEGGSVRGVIESQNSNRRRKKNRKGEERTGSSKAKTR